MTVTVSPRCGPLRYRQIDRLLDGTAILFQTLAEALLAMMLFANLTNIVLRNAGQDTLLWVQPATQMLMVWCVFLAFFVMYRRHLDIVLTLVIERFGQTGLKLSRALTAVAGLIVVGVLVAEAPQIVARQRGNMEVIGLTRHWLSIPLIASSLMLCIHFVSDLIGLAAGWHKADEAAGDAEATQW